MKYCTLRKSKCLCKCGALLITIGLVVQFYVVPWINSDASMSQARKNDAIVQREFTQSYIDYIGKHLQIEYAVRSNWAYTDICKCYGAVITITNTGHEIISDKGDWIIGFFHQTFFKQNVDDEPLFKIKHVQGTFFTMQPLPSFGILEPGAHRNFNFLAERSLTNRYHMFPNWYVTAPKREPAILMSTADEALSFVFHFDTPELWKPRKKEHTDPFTPEKRFDKFNVKDFGEAPLSVIPRPYQTIDKNDGGGGLNLLADTKTWTIVYQDGLDNEAKVLSELSGISNLETNPPKSKFIYLKLKEFPIKPEYPNRLYTPEGYVLKTDARGEKVDIEGSSAAGVYYGIQTLMSLSDNKDGDIYDTQITDAPRYEHRGLMLDVARNFLPKVEVMRIIKAMAMYKMNRLHLHLTDDEGWRLEIPGLPELTQIGARRSARYNKGEALEPALGSGPFETTSGSGFYTVHDYQEILKLAKKHHVQVIPEFDMPGHARAAIKSMEARFKKFNTEGLIAEATEYLLSDLDDTTHYLSVQSFTGNSINPCMPSTYKFVEKVMTEIIKMHKDITPLQVFHLGGDEIPGDAFKQSPECHNFLKANKHGVKHVTQLTKYFMTQVSRLAAQHGLGVQGWEDAFYNKTADGPMTKSALGNKNATVNAWLNKWQRGTAHRAYEYANKGYKVVMSQATHLYFDHPHEPSPEERGLNWATKYTDIKKVYEFMPENLYENSDRKGHDDGTCKPKGKMKCVPLVKQENLVGIQAQVWGELNRQPDHVQSQTFPRLIMVAEKAWHKAQWEDMKNDTERNKPMGEEWAEFANTLGYKESKRLERLGIEYYQPLVGIKKYADGYHVNNALPGLPIVYSEDGGNHWARYTTLPEEKFTDTLMFATRTHSGPPYRQSRPVSKASLW